MTARSPEPKCPPRKALAVAAGSLKYYLSNKVSIDSACQKKGLTNLLHGDVTTHDDLTNSLAISRDILELSVKGIAFLGWVYNTSGLGCQEGETLASVFPSPLIERELLPRVLGVASSEWTISLTITSTVRGSHFVENLNHSRQTVDVYNANSLALELTEQLSSGSGTGNDSSDGSWDLAGLGER